jgi:hypothetical protein
MVAVVVTVWCTGRSHEWQRDAHTPYGSGDLLDAGMPVRRRRDDALLCFLLLDPFHFLDGSCSGVAMSACYMAVLSSSWGWVKGDYAFGGVFVYLILLDGCSERVSRAPHSASLIECANLEMSFLNI